MRKEVSYKIVSLAFSVLVICFTVGFYVLAVWTEPTAAPPGGNVYAPINVGPTGQTKTGALRVGGLTVDNDTYLATSAGNVGIGTTNPGAKLEVVGQLKITGGAPDVGKVLTSDSSGLASWQFEPAIRMCNSVDTRSPVKKYHGWGSFVYSKGYDWTGYDTISMLIDGRNICEDENGCTYRIWAYSAAKPAGALFYTSYPVMFRQVDTHNWHDGYGDQTGINGDGTETRIIGSSGWNNFYMRDDWASAGGENSPDELTLRDNSATYAFLVTICDY